MIILREQYIKEKEPITSKFRMHIHPDRLASVSNSRILDIFCENKPRRLELQRLEDVDIGSSNSHIFNHFFCSLFYSDLLIQDSLNPKQAFYFVGTLNNYESCKKQMLKNYF